MVDLNANGKVPVPPYVAIDIISPKLPQSFLEDELEKQDIVLVERMEIQLRSVAETNAYAYMAGFDCRLRLQESYVDEGTGEILDIELNKGEITNE